MSRTTPADHPLTPHLVCDGAADAIDFYARAFGAEEMMRLPGAGGRLMHASVLLNGAMVMLVDENKAFGIVGPKTLGGASVTLHLRVADVDAAFDRAVTAGATPVMPPTDQFWGDRYAMVEDPFGHRWALAKPVRAMSAEEITAAAKAAMPDYAKS